MACAQANVDVLMKSSIGGCYRILAARVAEQDGGYPDEKKQPLAPPTVQSQFDYEAKHQRLSEDSVQSGRRDC